MKHSGFIHTTAVMLITLAAAPGFAADPATPARGPIPFDSMDADRSGFVSQEEFQQTHTERLQKRNAGQNQYRYMGEAPDYAAIDGDHDGRVSREELQNHQQERMLQRQQLREERQQQRYQERMDRQGGGMGPGGSKASSGGMGGGKR